MNISEEQNIDLSQENQLDFSRFTKSKAGGRWDHQQHLKFLHAIVCFGKDWKKVEEQVTTRTGAQKEDKRKKVPETTETELQLKQYFLLHPLTEHTPKQIIELLKIQKVGIKGVLQENCNENQSIHIKDLLESNGKHQKKNNERQNKIIQSQKNRSGQLEDLQQYEQQSFYMWFMRKNQQHFANGGLFSALIDYGKDLKGKFSLDQQQTSGNRKHSFTIFDMDLNPNEN